MADDNMVIARLHLSVCLSHTSAESLYSHNNAQISSSCKIHVLVL